MAEEKTMTMIRDQSSEKIQLPPEPHGAVIAEFGLNGDPVGPSEKESPWVPFGESASIRHLASDVRAGSVDNILWVKGGGRIGTHRHRGAVSAMSHCRANALPINPALFL
jgi:2,4'-dihydroxyacetophenone dioxygenase